MLLLIGIGSWRGHFDAVPSKMELEIYKLAEEWKDPNKGYNKMGFRFCRRTTWNLVMFNLAGVKDQMLVVC
jgi:hypothetical protein